MTKAKKQLSKRAAAKAATRRHQTVTWPARSDSNGHDMPPGKIRKTSLATITHTSKALNQALKRLADN